MTAQVERLYETFAAPRPAVVDYCDHCVDPADIAPFTTVPLRELTHHAPLMAEVRGSGR